MYVCCDVHRLKYEFALGFCSYLTKYLRGLCLPNRVEYSQELPSDPKMGFGAPGYGPGHLNSPLIRNLLTSQLVALSLTFGHAHTSI